MNTSATSNSFSFNPNDLVLIIGDSMGANCPESVRFAHELATSGAFGGVLHLNTFQRPKKHTRCIHQTLGTDADISEGIDGVHFVTSTEGELQYLDNMIEGMISEQGLATIVINSWEMSAGSSRRRERLMFQIQHWLCQLELTVIVYAQKSSAIPRAGYINRGGFGKLAGIADVVVLNFREDDERSEQAREAIAAGYGDEESAPAARTSINANGSRELAMETTVTIEDNDLVLRKWDDLGIPRYSPRVYFETDPHQLKHATLVEERFSRGRILMRTVNVATAEYDFPLSVPTELAPAVGLTLDEYLGEFRKGMAVGVHNDVGEYQGVTDRIPEVAEAA